MVISIGFPTRLFLLGSKSAEMHPTVGIQDGVLTPCPEKPNCVSSFAKETDEKHYLAYVALTESPLQQIKEYAKKMNMTLEKESEGYLHFTEKTAIFKFVDDIEFLYIASEKKLHFRSASRVGHSDMSANRKRMNAFLEMLRSK
ncbi:hypothetical protein A9Q84_16410 [Halobacteriovorax marinus]|uniref:DUF1499 domain-containing protein n=1 Tax=Halobacteriovorax marinus TaxID=97084 RepID=A0A1Y5F4Z1_9BACT|nr:hypothetical protein A9Q84_16410 [Halobacteriovorax marinus]